MKKIGVFLGVLFMGLLIFVRSPAPARADAWVLPFSKVPDILEMAQTLFSGGKLEFSSIISDFSGLDDIIEMWQDFKDRLAYSQTVERANTTLSALVDLTRSGISVIESSTDFVIPFTYDDTAAFIQYNPYWYLTNISSDPESIVENPDVNYMSYINCINGSINYGNYHAYIPLIRDYTYRNNSDSRFFHGTLENKTIYSYPISSDAHFVSVDGNQYKTAIAVGANVIDIRINGSDASGWTIADTQRNLDNSIFEYVYNNPRTTSMAVINYNTGWFDTLNGVTYTTASWLDSVFSTTYNSLDSALTAVVQNFRNVSLYVNGVLWSYAGVIVPPPVLAPDVINIGDTGLDTYDVYGLEQPDDLGLDIPNFIDWILNKLMEGATTISLDDAIAEEVPLVKTIDGVRAINYEDTRPVEQVIEITLDPDPNPTPTPNPDDPTPPILKLPTFNMMPAPHETTVLSELIDATQKTVPEELINLIWNCFGLLVIGGLIFILHK